MVERVRLDRALNRTRTVRPSWLQCLSARELPPSEIFGDLNELGFANADPDELSKTSDHLLVDWDTRRLAVVEHLAPVPSSVVRQDKEGVGAAAVALLQRSDRSHSCRFASIPGHVRTLAVAKGQANRTRFTVSRGPMAPIDVEPHRTRPLPERERRAGPARSLVTIRRFLRRPPSSRAAGASSSLPLPVALGSHSSTLRRPRVRSLASHALWSALRMRSRSICPQEGASGSGGSRTRESPLCS